MRFSANAGLTVGKIFLTAVLALTLALSAEAQERSGFGDVSRDQAQWCLNSTISEPASTPAAAESLALGKRIEVTNYVMDFEGDHSLDVATVVEQAFSGYASYMIHLHLASGAEQSIAVTAPPGGLRLEMHDMTGDKVPNDLVLRPTLIHWLPTVLVNDGHDHFAVAISNHLVDSLSSGQYLQSRGSDARGTAALMSSGLKAGGLTRGRELFPHLRKLPLAPATQAVVPRWEVATSSGRAPPTHITST